MSDDEFEIVVRRCPACDAILAPYELTTGAVVDRCPGCSQVVI